MSHGPDNVFQKASLNHSTGCRLVFQMAVAYANARGGSSNKPVNNGLGDRAVQ